VQSNTFWHPPRSPHGLLQEDLWPDEWKILIACLLLNLTTRKQVDGVIYELFRRWPTPALLETAPVTELEDLLKPLGMWRKRTRTLLRFNREYQEGAWKTAKDLHGCGKYADDCWHIFCVGDWRNVSPQDHALNDYHNYLLSLDNNNISRRKNAKASTMVAAI
jgi:methyl-CpG-binding domain protein 4